MTDYEVTLCAMVRAVSDAQAKDAVRDDWPEAGEWRFCDPRKTPEVTDRFPLKDWMVERLKTPNVAVEATPKAVAAPTAG